MTSWKMQHILIRSVSQHGINTQRPAFLTQSDAALLRQRRRVQDYKLSRLRDETKRRLRSLRWLLNNPIRDSF